MQEWPRLIYTSLLTKTLKQRRNGIVVKPKDVNEISVKYIADTGDACISSLCFVNLWGSTSSAGNWTSIQQFINEKANELKIKKT